ncbi:cation-binding protein [Vibrio sp. 10N.286.49.B3]|uniref:hemerythrin domain-containing protein n=1 Tax=Vibrio sp. 10N.286.49.B3 TaxID=1880855 RepID=UPI000C85C9B1|nr:hemerythrin domain-containing protein [Vibrio sp. 10N.286.49.B3]PMH39755.1 cation-binding protein [Vibrio sp. 10N.286.49.B3]
MMIERIRREHGYMVRLLAILRQKRRQLSNEQTINYSLVKEIVDYFIEHSDKVHHPKEDILYYYYIDKYGDEALVDDLAQEHRALADNTQNFLMIVDMILQDAVVPNQVFIEHLDTFVAEQKHHLEQEEKIILPLIAKTFTTQDWQCVESKWDQVEDDPVFGNTIADRYRQLAERVKQVDKECC